MGGVRFELADFVTGKSILDLPVMEGATWDAQLNRPDAIACKVDLNDTGEMRALDLRSATEPRKTVIVARTPADEVLAWGIITDRSWDDDARTLSINASGVLASLFESSIIGPATALTAALITLDADGYPVVNPALDTTHTGWSLGTIGKKLVATRLTWPGSTTLFDLPADEAGTHTRTYPFAELKTVGEALTDLSEVDGGPDFAFDVRRATDGLSFRYAMRHGSQAQPRIGSNVGVWSLGEGSPITGLVVDDSGASLGSAAWMTSGRGEGEVLFSRTQDATVLADGYPPLDVVDTSHSDVSVQATLDAYAAELIRFGRRATRDLGFTVRADAQPRLGQYRPGDTVELDVPGDHPYLTRSIPLRITSVSGDEAGLAVKIGCVIRDA